VSFELTPHLPPQETPATRDRLAETHHIASVCFRPKTDTSKVRRKCLTPGPRLAASAAAVCPLKSLLDRKAKFAFERRVSRPSMDAEESGVFMPETCRSSQNRQFRKNYHRTLTDSVARGHQGLSERSSRARDATSQWGKDRRSSSARLTLESARRPYVKCGSNPFEPIANVCNWPSADRPLVAAFGPKETSTKNVGGQRMKLDYPIGSCSARALVGSIVALQLGLRPMDS